MAFSAYRAVDTANVVLPANANSGTECAQPGLANRHRIALAAPGTLPSHGSCNPALKAFRTVILLASAGALAQLAGGQDAKRL